MIKSSRSQMFCKMSVLKNFTIITWKWLCWSFFNNAPDLKACNIIKIRLQQHRYWRTAFFIEHLQWLPANWSMVVFRDPISLQYMFWLKYKWPPAHIWKPCLFLKKCFFSFISEEIIFFRHITKAEPFYYHAKLAFDGKMKFKILRF